MTFEYPQYFWFLTLLLFPIIWYFFKKKNSVPALAFSDTRILLDYKKPLKQYLRHSLFFLRLAAIALLILICAHPRRIKQIEKITEGIDIVIALDISGSMQATDFKPNRFEASKNIAVEFINKQEYDRIGLVVFGSESFTQCPVTQDHKTLVNLCRGIKQGIIEDGTAIGYGLATAINNLKDADTKSKIIILLTDGENNAGKVDPETAADLAVKYNIKVYTVGVGKKGFVDMPVQTFFGTAMQKVRVNIDEETLKLIAKKTGGMYFRAVDNDSLKKIYQEIDKLEKDKIREASEKETEELYLYFLIPAIFLLFLEMLLRRTYFRGLA